MFMRQEITSAF